MDSLSRTAESHTQRIGHRQWWRSVDSIAGGEGQKVWAATAEGAR